MNDNELITKVFDKLDVLSNQVGEASGQRDVISNRLLNIEGEISRLRLRCETYLKEVQEIKVVLATHKGIIWAVSGVVSAVVAFTTAWIKTKW